MADLDDPVLKERIVGLKAVRDQAQADAQRAAALLESSNQQAITPSMVRKFARTAHERMRIEGGGYRRDHVRALAQRVEVAEGEVRIMGSKNNLLRTLAAASGAASATPRRSQFCSELAEGEGFEPWIPRKEANAFRDCPFTNKAGLKILVQRSWTDRHDCLAASLGTMYLISEGRQRGATRLHGSCFINELCGEISYVRDPCFVSRRTFSLADAQISHRCLGTEERCVAISHGSRCCPHDRAPAAFWTGEH